MTDSMIKLIAPQGSNDFYDELVVNLQFHLGSDGKVFVALGEARRDGSIALPTINEIIVTLGSAGAFSVLYQIVSAYLRRSDEREVTFEKDDMRITIKGHSLPEEKVLLKQLFANQETEIAREHSEKKLSRRKKSDKS